MMMKMMMLEGGNGCCCCCCCWTWCVRVCTRVVPYFKLFNYSTPHLNVLWLRDSNLADGLTRWLLGNGIEWSVLLSLLSRASKLPIKFNCWAAAFGCGVLKTSFHLWPARNKVLNEQLFVFCRKYLQKSPPIRLNFITKRERRHSNYTWSKTISFSYLFLKKGATTGPW